VRFALAPIYRLFEIAQIFALYQRLGQPTIDRYRQLIERNVRPHADTTILDLGCGIGSFRPCFPGAYTGVDINPGYIEKARASQSGTFEVMDCTRLAFTDGSFDEVVTIATMHHLDDDGVTRMVAEALRVCRPGGFFHVIDAILPVTPNLFKWTLFRLDRGNHPRRLARHLDVVGRAGRILGHEVLTGPMHDTVYVRVAPRVGR
jgi:SAM-dependent methyltransferase